MAICISRKRLQKELLKLEPVDINQLNEKGQKLRTLLLVLAGDKRVIDELNMGGIAELFRETPELLSLYDSQTMGCFDASQLVDYRNTLRRAL